MPKQIINAADYPEASVTLPVRDIVGLVEDLLADFDSLAVLIGQCAYQTEMQTVSNAAISQMLYLGERACILTKADILQQLGAKLIEDMEKQRGGKYE